MVADAHMVDTTLLFPPQWSPFQPPLSLPSLQAWLHRRGFSVHVYDGNLSFYDWLLSPSALPVHIQALHDNEPDAHRRLSYQQILMQGPEISAALATLKKAESSQIPPPIQDVVNQNYYFVRRLEAFFAAVSTAHAVKLSPYEFSPKNFKLTTDSIDSFIKDPPLIFKTFCSTLVDQLPASRCYGLSCIGQEQLLFTLYIGKLMRERRMGPIIVGGTILSRILDRKRIPSDWFTEYFDVIVRNEGERPLEALIMQLRTSSGNLEVVPSISYLNNGEIVSTKQCVPLSSHEVPTPDFRGLRLDEYYSAVTTLPILASRGCYWGKCEFCHHGMVYGEKYSSGSAISIARQIADLATNYDVKHFAFNDEAIPPKVLRGLGQNLPSNSVSGWNFTGLIKFEKYFTFDDFESAYKVGFRSLYVGLESASERVLALMKKNTARSTMVSNLRNATESGIWMHCFVFFGFPGETEEEAAETFNFVTTNPDIIGTFGCGTFSFEHNAPIFFHPEKFSTSLLADDATSVDVYYRYFSSDGISQEQASQWSSKLNDAGTRITKFRSTDWIPREHLLGLLAKMSPEQLVEAGTVVRNWDGLPPGYPVSDVIASFGNGMDEILLVSKVNLSAIRLTGSYAEAAKLMLSVSPLISDIAQEGMILVERLKDRSGRVAPMYSSAKVV